MRDQLRPFIGQRVGGEPCDELEHFYFCPACQQPVDMRDLAAVFHHEEPGHEPLPWEDAERLVRITGELRAAQTQKAPPGFEAEGRSQEYARAASAAAVRLGRADR